MPLLRQGAGISNTSVANNSPKGEKGSNMSDLQGVTYNPKTGMIATLALGKCGNLPHSQQCRDANKCRLRHTCVGCPAAVSNHDTHSTPQS